MMMMHVGWYKWWQAGFECIESHSAGRRFIDVMP